MGRSRWIGLACLMLGAGVGVIASDVDGATEREAYARTPDSMVPYGRTTDPYRRFYLAAPLNRGPGRDAPEPVGLESVRIGVLAPFESSDDVRYGRSLLHGVELAIAEANASGGCRGLPIEVVARNDQQLWGASSNTLVELAYVEKVWALIGSIDSNSTHVALRAALKAELPIVNVGSTDPTVTETGIPWIVRITPDDRQIGYHLASRIFEKRGLERVAVIRSTDRYGRFGVKEFRDAARRLRRPLPMELLIRPGQEDLSPQLERLTASGAQAVVLWLRAADAGLVVREIRARGIDLPVYGTDRLTTREFLTVAGDAAEGVETVAWTESNRSDEEWLAFRDRFRERYAVDPDPVAAYGYDAARLVVDAVEREGLNRARIRDALTALREYRGVSGRMIFDATSNNVAPVTAARVEGGGFVYD